MNIYDVGIIGAGLAGTFALMKIAQDFPKSKTIIFDLGRPPMKRRRQLEGWLGCLPNSDGKFYLSNLNSVANVSSQEDTDKAYRYFTNFVSKVSEIEIKKDNLIISSLEKKINNLDYRVKYNDYIQFLSKDIHALSKEMVSVLDKNKNITIQCDTEIYNIYKNENGFVLVSDNQEFVCKKIILAVGRSGWRWAHKVFKDFGIIKENDSSKIGFRLEMDSQILKDFNDANCSLHKNDIEVGPISWNGTIIPEDHVDLTITSFRNNEKRWETKKSSFNLIKEFKFKDAGVEQVDRLAKLTFILAGDRIIKERLNLFMEDKSKISLLKEYKELKNSITELASFIPDLIEKSYFHFPTIIPMTSKINLDSNLESELSGLFLAGETAGTQGLLSAAVSGIIAATKCQG